MTQRILLRAATIAIVVGILVLALVPHRPEPSWWPDTASHACAFFVISLCGRLAWPQAGAVKLLTLVAFLGGAIEIAQWGMAMGRDGEVSDWIVDLAAAALGWTVTDRIARWIS